MRPFVLAIIGFIVFKVFEVDNVMSWIGLTLSVVVVDMIVRFQELLEAVEEKDDL